ncbi:MAG: PAS domain S-box protein, partial [Bacillota bacterium]
MENEYLINQIKKLTGQLSQELNGNKTQGIKNKPMIIVALIIVLVLSLLFDYYEAKRLFDLYGGSLNFLPVILSTMISTSFVWLLLVYFNKVNFKNQHLNEMLLDMKDLTDSFIENQNKKIEQPGNEKSTLLNVIEFLPDAIFVVDNDNRIIFWNGMMETITGLNKCEVIGRDYNKIIPIIYGKEIDLMIDYMLNGKLEEISNDELGIYRNIKRRGDTINAEVSFPNAYNSRIAHCWISVSPLYNENGDKVGYIESIRDITEKKIMEDKLKTSHQFNQDILDSLSEQIAVLNKNGDIIAVNQSWNRFADENNSSRDKVGKGVNYLKVCRDSLENGNEDSGIVIEGIQSILDRKSKDFTFEYPCHSPAEKRWFALYASAMNNSKGVVVSHIDITRRKLKEEILKRYQLLVTHTTDIILFFDEKGNILEANKTAVKSYGYSRDELLQLSIHTI